MRQTAQMIEPGKTEWGATSRNETRTSEAVLGTANSGTADLVGTGVAGTGRRQVQGAVESLANLVGEGESLAEVAHEARNMVTALGLYSDLLEEPGVLNAAHLHYADELRLVATASRRLVEKLLALDTRQRPASDVSGEAGSSEDEFRVEPHMAVRPAHASHWDLMPAKPIDDLAGELLASRNLLSALAGPSIALTVSVEGSALPVRLSGEDLTRILVNLIKNAAEAMPAGGRIALRLHEFHAGDEAVPWLILTVEDSGPGISRTALDKIFESGYTTRSAAVSSRGAWPATHHGLGLSITRSIIEAAGGRIHATNRPPSGACFKIELPVRLR
jgi:signal transduction histidine kinase